MRFPLKYTIQPSGNQKLTFSPVVFSWGLVVTIFKTTLWSFNIYIILKNRYSFILHNKETNTTYFTAALLSVSNILIDVITFNNYSRKYSKFLDVCNTLNRFDHNLQLEATTCGLSVKSTSLIAISIVAPMIAQIVRIHTILSLTDNHTATAMNILTTICFYIIHCRQTGMLIHYQPVTRCLAERFRFINMKITQEVNNEICRQLMRQRNPLHPRPNQDRNANDRINSLMIAYHLLCDVVGQANDFYSDLLLASIFHSLLYVTSSLYILFIKLLMKDVIAIILQIVWTLSMICSLCMVVSSSSDVTQAAYETNPVICKIITTKNVNSGLRKQLNSFLLQLRRKHIEFSAAGCFYVNRQILTSMAATVATYLRSAVVVISCSEVGDRMTTVKFMVRPPGAGSDESGIERKSFWTV
ncbi:gustatory receptor [Homalodisca vitripennis]|nr:gustatory receptor [Homalodisca vitripennis]KAG8275300.1 gustatory receptor [Homalodisca vitripennis]